jgi:hypothetical protein
MDWPLAGAVTGVGVLACVVGFGTFALIRSAPEPVKRPLPTTVLWAPAGQPTTLIVLDPATDDTSDVAPAPPRPRASEPAPPKEKKKAVTQKPASDAFARTQPLPDQKKMAPAPGGAKALEPQVAVEQWRVITTSKASFTNLGGHVDKAGIVDNMANSHLREAFQKHRNFDRLPSHIKTHINTQNINLALIAPYRGLLGINDKNIEEEQGVKFVRVGAR